jgi:CubicO group peptidase (beta-lactamase class C family)
MKLFRLGLIFTFYFFITSTVLSSQDSTNADFKKDLDAFFRNVVEKLEIPGFSVVVVKGDQTLLCEGYGYADFENNLKADEHTNYYIASCTKSFTALLAAKLDSDGVLPFTDPLSKYFPDIKLENELDFDKIIIRDLLTHTAGIENNGIGWRLAFTGDHNLEKLQNLLKYTVSNKAGYENYEYSNIGYNIYTIILEKITGKRWQDWLQEEIFVPAGMNKTSAYISKTKAKGWNMAKPYLVVDSFEEIQLKKQDNTMQSAGGLITTPSDMAKWLKLQLNAGKLYGKQIIKSELVSLSHAKMVEVPTSRRTFNPTHYGLGWMSGTHQEKEVIHHFGGFAGFSTHMSFMPEEQIGISIMVNDGFSGNFLNDFLSSYLYNKMLNPEVSINTNDMLNQFSQRLFGARKRVKASIAERKNNAWTLSKEIDNYEGNYSSEEYGTMSVKEVSGGLNVSIGNMNCISTPFTKEETIRVELIPGRGQVIEFVIENQQIIGLNYTGELFRRI